MLLVSYDISDNKLRTKFSKFLEKYGYRMQYSLFKIKNSNRLLKLIEAEIKAKFEKQFEQNDSIIIFNLSAQCQITKYGYAKNEDSDIIFV